MMVGCIVSCNFAGMGGQYPSLPPDPEYPPQNSDLHEGVTTTRSRGVRSVCGFVEAAFPPLSGAGRDLHMPEEILERQPIPGPGLAVRILGEVTAERVALLQGADDIVVTEIKAAGLYRQIWQSFAVLLPVKSVGVMGDQRTYAYTCAIRAVHSEDGMTADWVPLPYEVLKTISSRIVNEIRGINRVVYDITSKPPGTIEWE
ncbi:MAG: hypothetical protein QOH85_516 [Acidobacteriaceae bacterium]|nr:hypothetical protein [Acidobacteriaceae bacterium]